MTTSILSSWKNNIFSNPFFAACQESDENSGSLPLELKPIVSNKGYAFLA